MIALRLVAPACLFLCARVASNDAFRVLRSLPVGHSPERIIANPKGNELYVANLRDDTVSVVDAAVNRVTCTIPVGHTPYQMAALRDGSRIYVGSDDVLTMIDTRTKVPTPVYKGVVRDIVPSPDGKVLYLAGEHAGLLVMDTNTHEIRVMDPQPAPYGLALSVDGRSLYVNYRSGGPGGRPGHDVIGVFDTRSGKLTKAIRDLPNVGGRIAPSPDGRFVWALGTDACYARRYDHLGCRAVPAGAVNILDRPTGELVRTLNFPGPAQADYVTFSPDGRWAVLSRGFLLFIDAATFQIRAAVPEMDVWSMVFQPDGRRAYVTIKSRNCVALVQLPAWLRALGQPSSGNRAPLSGIHLSGGPACVCDKSVTMYHRVNGTQQRMKRSGHSVGACEECPTSGFRN